MKPESTPPHPEAKPPIYSVEVIAVACRALEAICRFPAGTPNVVESADLALRIIRDGLASHEKAIKGEP